MEDALFIPACPTDCAEPFNDMIHKETIFDPNPENLGLNVSDADFDLIRSEAEPQERLKLISSCQESKCLVRTRLLYLPPLTDQERLEDDLDKYRLYAEWRKAALIPDLGASTALSLDERRIHESFNGIIQNGQASSSPFNAFRKTASEVVI